MPEGPEVEVAKRQLERWLVNKEVVEVLLNDPAILRSKLTTSPRFEASNSEAFWQGRAGRQVVEVKRHGKRLALVWDDGKILLHHLGMTGHWARGEQPRFHKLGLRVADEVIWFADMRRFGAFSLCNSLTELSAGHGPDALNEPIDVQRLQRALVGKRAIKNQLMDQRVLAGVGNIHAVEALFTARLLPTALGAELTRSEVFALAQALMRQLHFAVEQFDSDNTVYITQGGRHEFLVYGREGVPCVRCKTLIVKTKMSGRSTFFCPHCQDQK